MIPYRQASSWPSDRRWFWACGTLRSTAVPSATRRIPCSIRRACLQRAVSPFRGRGRLMLPQTDPVPAFPTVWLLQGIPTRGSGRAHRPRSKERHRRLAGCCGGGKGVLGFCGGRSVATLLSWLETVIFEGGREAVFVVTEQFL